MGQKCTTCTCISKDYEFVEEIFIHENKTQDQSSLPSENALPSCEKDVRPYDYTKHISSIIKIQSYWRGYTERKQVLFLRKSRVSNNRYFTLNEFRETLSFQATEPIEHEDRPEFRLESGAV